MSEQFAGLCIGGPYAGKQFVNTSRHMTVEERPPLKKALELSIIGDPVGTPLPPVKTHGYTWTHIGPFALWLHEETNLKQALEEMALAYQEKHT
jgi:hypothetical protein